LWLFTATDHLGKQLYTKRNYNDHSPSVTQAP